jgi:hypothetical protein
MNSALCRAIVVSTAAVGAAVTVTAATPAVAATAYSITHAIDPYTGHATVVRWSPCQVSSTGATTTHTITYRVNTAGAVSRVKLVQQALARVTSATGLHFRYLGTTSYIPHNAVIHYPTGNQYVFDAAQQRRRTGAELVVAWANASATNLLPGSEAGSGTVSWSASPTSQLRVVEAAVLMRRGVSMRSGFAAGGSVGTLLLHELGHAVGLNHVSTRSQIMYPTLGSWTPSGYNSGDLAGLRLLGRAAGCFRTAAAALADPAAIARAAGVSVTG